MKECHLFVYGQGGFQIKYGIRSAEAQSDHTANEISNFGRLGAFVVTTDADQVLVARADRPEGARHPIISYSAGALEDAGTEEAIRAQTVRLLEGGRDPFKTREKRYAFPA
ncbi:hypothetical protein [Novosphingobium sp. ZW T3_23]|uniref:hypothetical protein n=1 Tax=Novosphingobium sp. ZW T3_23 TaxID=3378084 RepID=UPI00385509D6